MGDCRFAFCDTFSNRGIVREKNLKLFKINSLWSIPGPPRGRDPAFLTEIASLFRGGRNNPQAYVDPSPCTALHNQDALHCSHRDPMASTGKRCRCCLISIKTPVFTSAFIDSIRFIPLEKQGPGFQLAIKPVVPWRTKGMAPEAPHGMTKNSSARFRCRVLHWCMIPYSQADRHPAVACERM